MQFKLSLAATVLAALSVSALPSGNKRDQAADLACGAIFSPLNGFLNYQAGNVAVSTAGIVKGINGLIDEFPDKSVDQIVSSATEGLANGLVNGVSAVLYGLSTGVINADPACKSNMAYCNNLITAAKASTASGQPEAKDACLQAKNECAAFYSSSQVDKMVPGCSQYTSS